MSDIMDTDLESNIVLRDYIVSAEIGIPEGLLGANESTNAPSSSSDSTRSRVVGKLV